MLVSRHGWAAFASAALSCLLASTAEAQALERNLPPAPKPPPSDIVPAPVAPSDQDATPIGPVLRGVVLLGASEAPRAQPAAGIDVAAAGRLSPDRVKASLAKFLGQPMSRRMIGQIQAAIALDYRRAGFPFVSVTTPAQELTSGVLQVRVIEFRLGRMTINGAGRTGPSYLESRIRVRPGQPIAAADLAEDLDSLNRYPFRRVDATFTPGEALGQSDLILNVTQMRPWSVYAGYSNSGSPSTGWDRYFAGAQIGGLLGRDSLISDQVTASADALFEKSRLFNAVSHPRYLSDAAIATVPMNPRALVEASFDWVETNQAANPFVVRQTTFEGRIGYRFALSNLDAAFSGWGQGRFGIEAKHQETETLFGGARALDLATEVYQAYVGYSTSGTDRLGRWDIDLAARISPGELGAANSRSNALLFSKGRVSDVRYAYLGLTAERYTKLPLGLAWTAQVIGQYAARALQGTEQMGIGGQGLVRGYVLDDGAYDEAIVLRNELRGPGFSLGPARMADQASPYIFVDAGSGRDQHDRRTVSAASIGAGLDNQIAGRINLGLDAAYALNRAIVTRAGDWRLETRAIMAF
jgi:hemolysin activation/secretion protein